MQKLSLIGVIRQSAAQVFLLTALMVSTGCGSEATMPVATSSGVEGPTAAAVQPPTRQDGQASPSVGPLAPSVSPSLESMGNAEPVATAIASADTATGTVLQSPAPEDGQATPNLRPLDLVVAFPWLEPLRNMVHLTHAGDGSGRVYVVLQEGRIVSFDATTEGGQGLEGAEPAVFLDVRDRVRAGEERGLLGLAFDPGYARNGHFYVNYTTQSDTVVARYTVDGLGGERADADSELVIMRVLQPYPNHNGGTIAFGHDGYLYIGLGDGGSGGDPLNSGQDLETLLGAMLRIDVSDASAERPYRIPPDNPFVHEDARPEIWAYGLRNPWRFSFDRVTGELWAGDVGQNSWEEVDLLEGGGNYGWNRMEGTHCFPSGLRECDDEGLEAPVIDYALSGSRCSVIGGVVYRGPSLPWLQGAYLYADYCSGELWGLRYDGERVTQHGLLNDSVRRITAFGEDEQGEVYALSFDGHIYRLAEAR